MKSVHDEHEPTKHDGHEERRKFCFRYEGKPYHSMEEKVTVLRLKEIVGQEVDVPLAEIVDGKQVERPNEYLVDLSKDCSFLRVPVFVRG